MPSLPEVVLQNVLRNVSNGLTYGQVEIINLTKSESISSTEATETTTLTSLAAAVTSSAAATVAEVINKTLTLFNDTLNDTEHHPRVTTESSVVCLNRTLVPNPTDLSEIPAKEIIIVIMMLALWLYSIIATWQLWHKILKA